ncbi:biopolymer transporter ExbD [Carboxylicivirga sp. N1Y90]|uniref:biopolymer transporter ExbD n=1 Tax=Carboxylicivirga fragile TaxID=3417571 RepID=UPI003D348C11|nr:hypothetical protein [Marinilabiliaceae bacterium N1Y90]
MYRLVLFLFLPFLIACNQFKLPKSYHNDVLPKRKHIEYIKLKITDKDIYLNKERISNLSVIPDFISKTRDEAKEDIHLDAIIYVDKNCIYSKVDTIIQKFREASIHRFYFKTNSLKESSYVRFFFASVGEYQDSLDNDILNKTKMQGDSLNILVVNKHSFNSYIVNDSLLNKKELSQKLENTIRDTIKCIYIINPGVESSIADVIEMADLYNIALSEKREHSAKVNYGQTYSELDDSLKWEINRIRFRKILNVIPEN